MSGNRGKSETGGNLKQRQMHKLPLGVGRSGPGCNMENFQNMA